MCTIQSVGTIDLRGLGYVSPPKPSLSEGTRGIEGRAVHVGGGDLGE